jgi:hypothetical protein
VFVLPCVYVFIIILSSVRLSPLGTEAAIGVMYQPQMIDDGDCGATGGMKRLIQSHFQWIPGVLSPGVKRSGREADH